MSKKGLTRRGFAAAAASVPLLAQQGPPNPNTSVQQEQRRRNGPPPEVVPFEAPIEFTRSDVKPKIEPFPMRQVRITGGIYKQAEEWNRGYMSRLAEDRLLYNFRQNAGLPTGSAEPLGGWEAPADGKRGTELRGHFTGHFLSASANLWASSGDKEAKAKGDSLVAELAKCQAKLGQDGYLSAFPTELFDRLDSLSGKPRPVDPATGRPAPPQPGEPTLPWAPFYTIHKIHAGLIDMYQLAGNKQALAVAEGIANWADKWSAAKSEAHMQEILNVEFGGMAESLYNLSALTNNDRWAKAGDRFSKKRFLNPLALRRDELRGLHVNTHIPQVIGAARRYEISGDYRFHDVADFFWWTVVDGRSYVTGGTSNGESWQVEPRRLSAEWKRSVATAECCCSYNMLKLTRHLFSWTGEPGYFDYYERVLLNHRIGTIHPQNGHTQYYLSMTPAAWKTFNSEDKSFWCCTGTGVEEYAKLNDSIYWRDADGVYVNLFVPSELNWEEKGFGLRQDTKFPEEPVTSLFVRVAKPTQMAVRLRIPAWLQSSPAVSINGKQQEVSGAPGSYLSISRVWNNNDHVELQLPMHLHMESMPDDPKTQAFLYGPLVLAGDLGTEGLTDRLLEGPSSPQPQRVPMQVPSFKASGELTSWIKPTGVLTFRTSGQQQDVTLAPINSLFDRRYSIYWQVG
jgi:DUF1680 family protein